MTRNLQCCSFLLLMWQFACGQTQLSGVQAYIASLQARPMDQPVYPFHISTALDGPLSYKTDMDQMRMHYMLTGLNNISDIVQRGMEAVDYFNQEFGTDFSKDETAILNGTTCCGGAITMIPVVFDVAGHFRVISFATLHQSVKMNNRLSVAGWNFVFNSDYQTTGSVNRLIPASSFALWHDTVVRIGENAEVYTKDQPFPGPVFNYRIVSNPVIFPVSAYDGSIATDCKLYHKDLGEGQLRGLLVPDVDDPADVTADTIWHGRQVYTWPSTLPSSLPSINSVHGH